MSLAAPYVKWHQKRMKTAELVTFGSSGLDRAAVLRGDEAALRSAQNHPQTD